MAAEQLFEAAAWGRVDEVRQLLDQGVHPDESRLVSAAPAAAGGACADALCWAMGCATGEQFGWTALMLAANNGNMDIVRLLLDHGANTELADYVSTGLLRGAHADDACCAGVPHYWRAGRDHGADVGSPLRPHGRCAAAAGPRR